MEKNQIRELCTERVQFLLPKSLLEKVDDWGFANRLRTRAQAFRSLAEKGLAAEAAKNGNGADSLETESPVTENHAALSSGMTSTQQ